MKNVVQRMQEENTEEKIAAFRLMQEQDYQFKLEHAELRAWDFFRDPAVNGMCYVAVGGLDSITLLLFLRHIGIDAPAVSVSGLEDRSIQRVHRDLGVKTLLPAKKPDGGRWNKAEVIREFGFPVISNNPGKPCKRH